MRRKRLPPYGRAVRARIKRERRTILVYAGELAWQQVLLHIACHGSQSAALALALPPGDDFEDYAWPVRGQDVVLLWQDGTPDSPGQDITHDELVKFAARLVQDGATLVIVPRQDDPILYARPTTKRCPT